MGVDLIRSVVFSGTKNQFRGFPDSTPATLHGSQSPPVIRAFLCALVYRVSAASGNHS